MKFATIIFVNCVSSLFSLKKISSEKRGELVDTWVSAVKCRNLETMNSLLNAVLLMTENERFRSDIRQAISSLE